MLDALLNILNGFTDIPFVELAWSHSPDDKYGVITLDNQIPLNADADPVSEKMLTGFVDVFVKKPQDLSTVTDVESAMKRLGIWFALNSVQFEDDTGYVHYEWEWRDATNIVASKLYVIRFRDHYGDVVEPQIVKAGYYPVIPTGKAQNYTENGITYIPYTNRWSSSVVRARANAVYDAVYYTEVTLKGYAPDITAWHGDDPFTATQINALISFFDGGGKISCVSNGGSTRTLASAIDTEKITWNESVPSTRGSAKWGTV